MAVTIGSKLISLNNYSLCRESKLLVISSHAHVVGNGGIDKNVRNINFESI